VRAPGGARVMCPLCTGEDPRARIPSGPERGARRFADGASASSAGRGTPRSSVSRSPCSGSASATAAGQPFDRPKLLRGLARAIAKRPISLEDVERLSFEVEGELRALGYPEIESALIGDAALRLLGALDGVAYVRFASVYRQFDDVGEFQRELELLDAERTSVR